MRMSIHCAVVTGEGEGVNPGDDEGEGDSSGEGEGEGNTCEEQDSAQQTCWPATDEQLSPVAHSLLLAQVSKQPLSVAWQL